MRKGFLIYEEMSNYFPMYGEAVIYIWLCYCSILNFLIFKENFILFFISVRWYFKSKRLIWDPYFCSSQDYPKSVDAEHWLFKTLLRNFYSWPVCTYRGWLLGLSGYWPPADCRPPGSTVPGPGWPASRTPPPRSRRRGRRAGWARPWCWWWRRGGQSRERWGTPVVIRR